MDGFWLVQTEEWVGFQKDNTADGVAGLIRFAEDLVPSLAGASFRAMLVGAKARRLGWVALPGGCARTRQPADCRWSFSGGVAAVSGHCRPDATTCAGPGPARGSSSPSPAIGPPESMAPFPRRIDRRRPGLTMWCNP